MYQKFFELQKLGKIALAEHVAAHASALFSRVRTAFMMLLSGRTWLAAALVLGLCATASADDVLFENVRIFDGKGAALSAPSNVLVEGNVIEQISTDPIEAEGAERIAGNGRTLMPGLIDAHWHAMLIATTPAETMNDIGFATLAAGDEATDTLMRGFTTVRDVGGPAFGLKRAIDQGIIEGPRIYPSGAMITVTSGHGDFRQMSDLPRKPGLFTPMEINGGSIVVDSPDEVRLRAREQFMQGAVPAEVDGGRRRVVAPQPARRHHLHRARIAGGGRNCRELGHLRRRARLHVGSDPNVHRGRREVHRARLPHERGRRQADRGKGHLA